MAIHHINDAKDAADELFALLVLTREEDDDLSEDQIELISGLEDSANHIYHQLSSIIEVRNKGGD